MYKKKDEKQEDLFRNTFLELSSFLETKYKFEKDANQYNMESGIPLEDYFRQEFGKFVPNFYNVGSGKIIDKEFYTCGDCDFIIYDDRFSPFLKFPSTEYSRRKIFAFETTYGIIEIKQKLTLGALDDKNKLLSEPKGHLYNSLQKMISYKELSREVIDASKIIPGFKAENWKSNETQFNRPFALAFFYDCENSLDLTDICREYYTISNTVDKNYWSNGIFVLNKFALIWTRESKTQNNTHNELLHPNKIDTPRLSVITSEKDTLYLMYSYLWKLLVMTHLGKPQFQIDYGANKHLKDFDSLVYDSSLNKLG